MADYDVFNGDADGICALIQLRNADPRMSTRITGVKRDISLLRRVDAKSGDRITVLDISLDKNRDALHSLLDVGAEIFYSDHHFVGEIPVHENLHALINTAPDVCTSVLVNSHLRGQFAEWAIVGAFGDNLRQTALTIARSLPLNETDLATLERLGIYLNYNAYGSSIDDLHFAPDELFALLNAYATPRQFVTADTQSFQKLEVGYDEDIRRAALAEEIFSKPHATAILLPNATWARRVSGVFSNQLANAHPERAHAVITERLDQGYLVSVRAPLTNKSGADEICRQFPTGGGRKAAAGINDLPPDQLEKFLQVFSAYYRG